MKIYSEDDAFAALRAVLNDEAAGLPDFEEWPDLHVILRGPQFDGTLTPGVMRGFVEFQYSVYRSFAAAKYGIPDARRLSEDEKKDLEIIVHVEAGSSVLEVDIQALLEKLVVSVAGRMTPNEVIILAISLALIWSGTTLLRNFLNNRKEVALKKLDEDGRARLVAAVENLKKDEKDNLRTFGSVLNENARVLMAHQIAQQGQTDLLKGFSEADEVEIQGQTISGEAIRYMARSSRRKAVEMELEGLYMIRRVDTTDPLLTRVKVVEVGGEGYSFDANVQDDMLSLRKKQALQAAEWGRHPVHLNIQAKMLDDDIRDAVVTEVTPLTAEELAKLTSAKPAPGE